MTDEQTLQKLREMRMYAMADCFEQMARDGPSNEMSVTEQIGLMVDREWTERENRRLARLIKAAKIATGACLEDLWCDPTRGIDKPTVRMLASCSWIRDHHNVIVVGKTGVGKSFIAAALAQAACRNGHKTFCTRVPRLALELGIARADGSYNQTLNKLARTEVLVLDDFLLAPLKDPERRDLLEVLEDRYDKVSTVITSQVPTKNWHQMLEDPTIADAICDRLVHNAYVLNLKGPSIRKLKAMNKNNKEQKPKK